MFSSELIIYFILPVTVIILALLVIWRAAALNPTNGLFKEMRNLLVVVLLFLLFQTPSPILEFVKKMIPPSLITHSISLYVLYFGDRIMNGAFSEDKKPATSKVWLAYLMITQSLMIYTFANIDFSHTKVTVTASLNKDGWAYTYLMIYIGYIAIGLSRFFLLGRKYYGRFPEKRRRLGILAFTIGVFALVIVGVSMMVLLSLWYLSPLIIGQLQYGEAVKGTLVFAAICLAVGGLASTDFLNKVLLYFYGVLFYIQLWRIARLIWEVFPENKLFEYHPTIDLLRFDIFQKIIYRLFIEISDARLILLSHVSQSFVQEVEKRVAGKPHIISPNEFQINATVEAVIFHKGLANRRQGKRYSQRAMLSGILDNMDYRQQLAYFTRVSYQFFRPFVLQLSREIDGDEETAPYTH